MRPLLILAAAALAVVAAGAPVRAATRPAITHVSYLAGGSVYLAAGRLDGLAEGDTLQAVGGGRVVAFLVVRYLSSHRAACDTLKAIAMPAVGDEVWYQARPVAPAAPAAEPGPAAAALAADSAGTGTGDSASAAAPDVAVTTRAAAPSRRSGRLRGRIGARYLVVDGGAGAGFSQPGLDLRLDGANIAGTPLDLAVDVRSRRTYHGAPGVADDGEARVYRMSLAFHDARGRRRVTLGRQMSTLPAVSLFDGALVEYAGERWSGGLLSGTQPDPASWAVSGQVIQHGGFVGLRGRQGARRWSVTTGGIASFDHGQVNRDFAFLQGSYLDPRLAFSLSEELDLNTGWKRAMGEPALALTGTFASARAQLARAVSVNAGFDNRRNVRLYRDRLTPETEFDDRYRQGAWAGGAVEVARHVRIAADGRWSGGGAGGDYRSWSAATEAFRLTPLQADLRWRSTFFSADVVRGWLHAAGLGVRPWGQTRIELTGGQRTSDDGLGQVRTRLTWEGLDLDLGLGGRWYLLLSGERDHGDGLDTSQGHASLSWMF